MFGLLTMHIYAVLFAGPGDGARIPLEDAPPATLWWPILDKPIDLLLSQPPEPRVHYHPYASRFITDDTTQETVGEIGYHYCQG